MVNDDYNFIDIVEGCVKKFVKFVVVVDGCQGQFDGVLGQFDVFWSFFCQVVFGCDEVVDVFYDVGDL